MAKLLVASMIIFNNVFLIFPFLKAIPILKIKIAKLQIKMQNFYYCQLDNKKTDRDKF